MSGVWMAAGIAAMLAGALILLLSITRMLDLLRRAEVANLPAAAAQDVVFDAARRYVLHIEQPRLSSVMTHAAFLLRDTQGQEVRSMPSIFSTHRSGFSITRLSVREFEVAQAGVYRFTVTGMDSGGDASRVRLIFTRPYGSRLFLLIVGTVSGGAGLIGGLVFTALLYTGKLAF